MSSRPALLLVLLVLAASCGSSPSASPGSSVAAAMSAAASAATSAPSDAPSSSPAATAAATAPAPADWPVYQLDAGRTGKQDAFPAFAGKLQAGWTTRLDGAVYAEPLVVHGRLIAATEGDSVYALDPHTGATLWRQHLGTPVRLSTLPCGNIDPLGITGDSVDVAFLKFASSRGIDLQHVRSRFPRKTEVPFDSSTKLMMTTHLLEKEDLICMKGAPEVVLRKCDTVEGRDGADLIDPELRKKLLADEHRFGEEGLKTVALAYSLGGAGGFTFLGLAGFLDEEKEGVREAVAELHRAGVKVVMITGDAMSTAKAIAGRLGIYTGSENAISGAELEKISAERLAGELGRTTVFYRTTPAQKLKILEGYKEADLFVAMTGDGVNDAPALKAANVGVAMGQRGTEVAKETADLVLLDDNFSTIASAVEEGRGIFNNIKKAVAFLLAANLAEIAIVTLITFAGMPTPLLPVHLLWINLVTDIVPVLPLALDPPSPQLMETPPLKASDSILSKRDWLAMALTTIYFSAVSIVLFDLELNTGIGSARGLVFSLVVVAELFMVLMFRAYYDRTWQVNWWLFASLILAFVLQLIVTGVPPVAGLFQVDSLTLLQWLQLFIICLPIIAATVLLSRGKRFKKAPR